MKQKLENHEMEKFKTLNEELLDDEDHPELIDLAQRRNDTRVVFLQHPILSESSKIIAEMVVAANYQDKGTELHNGLFSIS